MSKKLLFTLAGTILLLTACGKTPEPQPTPTPEPTPAIIEYSFTFNGTNCTCNNESKYERGKKVTLEITPEKGYSLPETIIVAGSEYTYDKETGKVELTINSNVSIECVATCPKSLFINKVTTNGNVMTCNFERNNNELSVFVIDVGRYSTIAYSYYYKDGLLESYEYRSENSEGEIETETHTYAYNNAGLLIKTYIDNQDYNCAYQYEYNDQGLKTKEAFYINNKLINTYEFSYAENIMIQTYNVYNEDGSIYSTKLTKEVTTVDEDKNTKTVEIQEYNNDKEIYEIVDCFVYDLTTNHLLEEYHDYLQDKYTYTYNEFGNLISIECVRHLKDISLDCPKSLKLYEYNEDQTLKLYKHYLYNDDTEEYDNLKEDEIFTVDENGIIIECIYKEYVMGFTVYTETNEIEYIEIDYPADYIVNSDDVKIERAITPNDYYNFLIN